MATKIMTPEAANELLNALATARAACAKALEGEDYYTDLHDRLGYTIKHIDETYDAAMSKFVPPFMQRSGGK